MGIDKRGKPCYYLQRYSVTANMCRFPILFWQCDSAQALMPEGRTAYVLACGWLRF
jgi:hypothetical protein